jgi:hypothetical protein
MPALGHEVIPYVDGDYVIGFNTKPDWRKAPLAALHR